MVNVDWFRTGEADEKDLIDDRLIERLRLNFDVARDLECAAGWIYRSWYLCTEYTEPDLQVLIDDVVKKPV